MMAIPGPVAPKITLLGRPESCVYLVDGGSESMLVEGGMAYLAPDIIRQIRTFRIDESKIKRLIILHSHFDHCGLIPFLKQRWPWATVSASARARQLLSDPEVTQRIADLNQATIERAGLEAEAYELGFAFTRIDVEETFGDGGVISCGDVAAEVIEVPGHSSCSIALYLPEEKALFVSDAAGVRHKDFFLPTGNSNYDLYQASLEKMAQYDVDLVLCGHFGVADGKEAHELIPRAIEDSKASRVLLESSYERTQDVKKSTDELVQHFMERAPENFLSRDVYEVIMSQMMRYIAKRMDAGPTSHR